MKIELKPDTLTLRNWNVGVTVWIILSLVLGNCAPNFHADIIMGLRSASSAIRSYITLLKPTQLALFLWCAFKHLSRVGVVKRMGKRSETTRRLSLHQTVRNKLTQNRWQLHRPLHVGPNLAFVNVSSVAYNSQIYRFKFVFLRSICFIYAITFQFSNGTQFKRGIANLNNEHCISSGGAMCQRQVWFHFAKSRHTFREDLEFFILFLGY